MNTMLQAAREWHHAGFCVVRAASDGTKRPVGEWAAYQRQPSSADEIERWFATGHTGIGIVCGEVSGGVEMLELEGRAVAEGLYEQLLMLVHQAGLDDLWWSIDQGYCERTPTGGYHWIYRIGDGNVPRNTKLARRPATEQEIAAKPDEKIKVLVETRGEGGFVVVAPSNGTVHPTGRPWTTMRGHPGSAALIGSNEREQLIRVIRCLDQMPAATGTPRTSAVTRTGDPSHPDSDRTLPGDDYEARTDWSDLLGQHGWTLVAQHGRTRYWRRPGKDRGFSATTGHADDRDRLFVFSTSTVFEAEHPYTKFGAYSVLEHGGDYRAAARALAGPRPMPSPRPNGTRPAPDPDTDEPGQTDDRTLVPVPASKIELRIPKWLWDWRIPNNAVSLLAGREGIGKSSYAISLAAQITNGVLPGHDHGHPRGVIIVATEDAWGEVIKPRLIAAGANQDLVYRVDVIDQDQVYGTLSIPADLRKLEALCDPYDIALVVCDPLLSLIHGSIDTHKDQQVRQALTPLSGFAARAGVAILGLIHVNKSGTTDPLNAVMASKAFTAVARSVLFCVEDPDHPGVYLLGHPKSNLGPKQPTLSYQIQTHRIQLEEPDEDGYDHIVTSKVAPGDDDHRTIREILEQANETRRRTDQGENSNRIVDWVIEQGRPVSRQEIGEQFSDLKAGTVDSILSRLVARGQ